MKQNEIPIKSLQHVGISNRSSFHFKGAESFSKHKRRKKLFFDDVGCKRKTILVNKNVNSDQIPPVFILRYKVIWLQAINFVMYLNLVGSH